jgi:hypothetical protein
MRSKVDFGVVFATALGYILFSLIFKFVRVPVNVFALLVASAAVLLVLGN